jgi:hypothetical protein
MMEDDTSIKRREAMPVAGEKHNFKTEKEKRRCLELGGDARAILPEAPRQSKSTSD